MVNFVRGLINEEDEDDEKTLKAYRDILAPYIDALVTAIGVLF